jgi:hypothetical protein
MNAPIRETKAQPNELCLSKAAGVPAAEATDNEITIS